MIKTLFALIEIGRPKHWVKNSFVFAPLIFAREFLNPQAVMTTFTAFAMFCLFSSCVYMLNDIADLQRDREHPEKRNRPLPSGRLRVKTVVIAMMALLTVCTLVSYTLSPHFLAIAYTYIFMNILYSFYCKDVVILDGMIIAAGFVLRAYAGAVVIGAEFSDWLYICATFVSLFLAFSKRRHEILLLGDVAKDHRVILSEYSIQLLDRIIAIVSAATIVTYALYCIDSVSGSQHESMKYTLPFVIYGLFRYLYLVYQKDEGGNPTELLLSDIPLIVNGLLWLGAVFWALR